LHTLLSAFSFLCGFDAVPLPVVLVVVFETAAVFFSTSLNGFSCASAALSCALPCVWARGNYWGLPVVECTFLLISAVLIRFS